MEAVSRLVVDECALPYGFCTTPITLPVCVIDVAVLVVASMWTTDTLVFVVVVRWERCQRAVLCCVFDACHVLADGSAVDMVRTCNLKILLVSRCVTN